MGRPERDAGFAWFRSPQCWLGGERVDLGLNGLLAFGGGRLQRLVLLACLVGAVLRTRDLDVDGRHGRFEDAGRVSEGVSGGGFPPTRARAATVGLAAVLVVGALQTLDRLA